MERAASLIQFDPSLNLPKQVRLRGGARQFGGLVSNLYGIAVLTGFGISRGQRIEDFRMLAGRLL